MSVLEPKSCIRTDLQDLALSSMDSVPTSRRPIEDGGMLYLRRREETVVRAREYTSGVARCQ